VSDVLIMLTDQEKDELVQAAMIGYVGLFESAKAQSADAVRVDAEGRPHAARKVHGEVAVKLERLMRLHQLIEGVTDAETVVLRGRS
jgi:hypothetical protein